MFTNNATTVKAFGIDFKKTALITLLTSFTFIIVSFLSPLLSGIADYMGNKFSKILLLGAIGTLGLNWFSLEQIYISLLFYFIGLLGFGAVWFL